MGSFNVVCTASNLSINCGDEVVCFVLEKSPQYISNFQCNGYFTPTTLPIEGEYNDYGVIENIKRDWNVELIEKTHGKRIENYLEDNRFNICFVLKKVWNAFVNFEDSSLVYALKHLEEKFERYGEAKEEVKEKQEELDKLKDANVPEEVLNKLSLRVFSSMTYSPLKDWFRDMFTEKTFKMYEDFMIDSWFQEEIKNFHRFYSSLYGNCRYMMPGCGPVEQGGNLEAEEMLHGVVDKIILERKLRYS